MVAKAPEPTLNLAEAAAYLGWGQSTLRGKLAKGKGPTAIKLPGSSRWRFRPRDLDAYINGGEIPTGTAVRSPSDECSRRHLRSISPCLI